MIIHYTILSYMSKAQARLDAAEAKFALLGEAIIITIYIYIYTHI